MDQAKSQFEPAEPEKLGLSATQLVASGLAAMSATVAASFFGVAGTVIGAALGSIISVIGNAVYSYSLRRTRRRVRTLQVAVVQRLAPHPGEVVPPGLPPTGAAEVPVAVPNASEPATEGNPPASGSPRRPLVLRPRSLAVAGAGVFLAVLAATTGFELASGQPLSATVTGKHGSGVSIGGGSSKKSTVSPSPSTSNTGSSTPSGPATSTSPTSTDTSSTEPSSVPPSPSDSPSPSEGGSSTAPAGPGPASTVLPSG